MYHDKYLGPFFGTNDLGLCGESMNTPANGNQYKMADYKVPVSSTDENALTGVTGNNFTCYECEIYKVVK